MKKFISRISIISFILLTLGCKKSSDSIGGPQPCTTDSCILTSHTWRIASSTIYTDIGNYPSTTAQLATLEWVTFLFKPDSTVMLNGGGHGNYTYTASNKSLVLIFNTLSLHFDVTSLMRTTLTFIGSKVQMNPQTDTSPEAAYAIKGIAGNLHDNFGVDTSKIHYVQVSFSYY